jgi:hypothetical protein
VLDRASTFADPEIVQLLKTRFVPVAIDQAYQRRQQDAEGEFYRKLAGQGPRDDFNQTTQGLYVGTAGGRLLAFNNNRGPDRIRRLMKEALAEYRPEQVDDLDAGKPDPRHSPKPPEGGLVVRVNAKVLGGYPETDDRWKRMFHDSLSRDNFWITGAEHRELVDGRVPRSLARRLARFHLIDNTRGEPPMWREDEIEELTLTLEDGKLSGRVRLKASSGDRGYECQLVGVVEVEKDRVTCFDVVAKGQFWGEGRYTGGAPKGKFPLAVAFRLADGTDVADRIPPHGSRGWVQGYIR